VGEKSIGILEVFSGEPDAFSEAASGVLQRLSETVLAAINRSARAEDLPPLRSAPAAESFPPRPGSVLFASEPTEKKKEEKKTETSELKVSTDVSLPGSHLAILIVAAAAIAMVLGYTLAPWIQSKVEQRGQPHLQTVLASSRPPKSEVATASLDQLRQMAEKGDAVAENSLGLRYATGDGVKLDEAEAVRWFAQAAEHGSVAAQSKLGTIYFSGRGVPQDSNRAYFWMVVARISGDDASKTLSPFVRARLTRAQITSIELDANRWIQQHGPALKPAAGH
jgi:TPR repeat protein